VLAPAPALASIWPSSAARVERELASPKVEVRRRAARELTSVSQAAAERLVAQALSDEDLEVRLDAASAALAVPVPGASDLVVPWLTQSEARLRRAAAEVIGQAPSERAVAPLARTLSDPEAEVRIAVARALGRVKDARATSALLGRLDDGVLAVRLAVIESLAQLEDSAALLPLVGRAQDPQPAVRRAAVLTLGALGDTRAAGAVMLALRDTDESVRLAAAQGLGALRDKSVGSALAQRLSEDPSAVVRVAAARALARHEDPEHLRAVVDALVRARSREELAALRAALREAGEAARGPLEVCVAERSDPMSTSECARALALVGARGFSADGNQRAAGVIERALRAGRIAPAVALDALGELAAASSTTVLLEYVAATDGEVARRAARALARVLEPLPADGRVVEPLAHALAQAHADSERTRALVLALGKSKTARAAAALLPFARDASDEAVRSSALEALGDLPAGSGDAALLRGLRDPEPAVRRAAALAAFRSLSGLSSGAVLRELTESADRDRVAHGLALGGAFSNASEVAEVTALGRRLDVSAGSLRDALIEALARAPGAAAERELLRVLRAGDRADRRKLAEAWAARVGPRGGGTTRALVSLLADPEPSVRQAAAWSLGASADASSFIPLFAAARDTDPGVAANATAAVFNVFRRRTAVPERSAAGARETGARETSSVVADLCALTEDARPGVRAAAVVGWVEVLFGPAVGAAPPACLAQPERFLRASEPASVRAAGARWLWAWLERAPAEAPERAVRRRALARCADRDRDAGVAELCSGALRRSSGSSPLGVFVVPPRSRTPRAEAPYVLAFADGTRRYGVADRRGFVFVAQAPLGVVRLITADDP
jgi:HEAT repeat protein